MAGTTSKLQALKGLSGVAAWQLSENSLATYTHGAKTPMPSASALTKQTTKSEYTIYADDGVYDSGGDYQYTDLTLTLVELPLAIQAALEGGVYNEANSSYDFKTTDQPPEFALGFAALMRGGGYRMWLYYAAKLMSVTVNHATAGGDNGNAQTYELAFRATQRKMDNTVGTIRDGDDKTWLDDPFGVGSSTGDGTGSGSDTGTDPEPTDP
jgi:phi13 family phage major tail protein